MLDVSSTRLSSPTTSGTGASLILPLLFGAVVPIGLGVLVAPPTQASFDGWPIVLATVAWSGLRLGMVIASGTRNTFAFSFWLFTHLFMGVAAYLQIAQGEFPDTTPNVAPEFVETAAVVVAIGIVSYEFGGWVAGHRIISQSGRASVLVPSFQRGLILLAIGLAFSAYFVRSIGFGTLFSSLQERQLASYAAWPNTTVAFIAGSLSYVPLLAAIHVLRGARFAAIRNGAKVPSHLWSVLAAALVLLVANPMSSPRYVFGVVALSVSFAFGSFANRKLASASMLAVTIAFVFIFPYADAFRFDDETNTETDVSTIQVLAKNGDYDAFGQIVNTGDYVDSVGYEMGRQMAGAALFWIPRSVWPTKPEDTGTVLAEWKDYGFTNLSAPLWAEAYIDFGVGGVIGVFAALGYATRRVGVRLASLGGGTGASIYAGVLGFYLIFLLRGSLLQATSTFVLMVACSRFGVSRLRPGALD